MANQIYDRYGKVIAYKNDNGDIIIREKVFGINEKEKKVESTEPKKDGDISEAQLNLLIIGMGIVIVAFVVLAIWVLFFYPNRWRS